MNRKSIKKLYYRKRHYGATAMTRMNKQMDIKGLQAIMTEFMRENEKSEMTEEMIGMCAKKTNFTTIKKIFINSSLRS
jgi:hypothetical protein